VRIRSIKPEFWRSEDITAIEDWGTRLLFIGLWSYVDDNGVGRDRLADITADLLAGDLEKDPRDTFASVSRGLQTLSELGRITRYTVAGRGYLHITNWEKHQRIDKPNKERYPLPTCDDAEVRESVARVSRETPEIPAPGTEEQRNRGTDLSCAPADAEREFDEWYDAYPRKRGRGQAVTAYRKARKKADAETLLRAIKQQTPTLISRGLDYVPYPATWLNGERWADEPPRTPQVVTDPSQLPPVEQTWMRRRPRD
jgi:hypothetical protein